MKNLVIGILAHVDAGKTTLSESILYLSGKIRKLGRVDNKDAYLDSFELERARGITIFSKQARLEVGDVQITLLDTPGHVDFSTEMERTLQVMDYAILVVSGADGVQAHTKTLWRLLDIYNIPVFIFINKMDQSGTDKHKIASGLTKQLSDGCVEFGQGLTEDFYDQLAMCDEALLEAWLDTGHIQAAQIREAIINRKVFPCYFGSALKLEGVEALIQGIEKYAETPAYPDGFGAKIYKIGRDEQGNRLTYMRITGGRLKVKDTMTNGEWEEKVNQIRIYSGLKFEAVNEAEAGVVCAVTGLSQTKPGEGLGFEKAAITPILEPVLSYRIILPEGCDPRAMLPKLRQLEEEDPELHIVWDEQLKEIQARIMGEVQVEILQSLIKSRFGIDVTFDSGRIVYKETIANAVEGVGHFEPLRHYAEVHLLLEPAERGSGLHFKADCSDDILAKSWKNLVLSHLKEKVHKGVLTGSPITDMTITLVSGRAHNKHTEGGDFREATWRAVRQGLKEAESILLEPYYAFEMELPEKMVGRAMTDIEKMHGTCQISQMNGETAVLTGNAPVVAMRNYQREVTAYTKGYGRFFCNLKGYELCHNPDEVIEMIGYDSERDIDNPTGSVFCANGTGFLVNWDEVKKHMHIESCLQQRAELPEEADGRRAKHTMETWLDAEEVDRIFKQTFFANQGKKSTWHKRKIIEGRTVAGGNVHDADIGDAKEYKEPVETNEAGEYAETKEHGRTIGSNEVWKSRGIREFGEIGRPDEAAGAGKTTKAREANEAREKYLLVDGYNIIFAWPDLKKLAEDNMDGARSKLLDYLIKYQGIQNCQIIAVFDAYRVQGHNEEILEYDTIHVVFTREAQTADQFIEKFAHDNYGKYDITVATSDGLQQIIIRGAGCAILSARELREEMERVNNIIIRSYQDSQPLNRNYIEDTLSSDTKQRIEELIKDDNGG